MSVVKNVDLEAMPTSIFSMMMMTMTMTMMMMIMIDDDDDDEDDDDNDDDPRATGCQFLKFHDDSCNL